MEAFENKEQFIRRLQSSRRKLERSIFYFERNENGDLQAGRRLKHSVEEMTAPGVAGSWSMMDVLADVSACEQAFIRNCRLPTIVEGSASLMVMDSRAFPSQPLGDRSPSSVEEVLKRFMASYQEMLALIQGLSQEALFAPKRLAGASRRLLIEETAEATIVRYERASMQIRQWQVGRIGRERSASEKLTADGE